MPILFPIFVFIFGALIGSFLNVVIFRWQTGESFAAGRSHCPHCGRTIAWYDLFPIISWLYLRGRCRYCRRALSGQYPLVEAATGALFLAGQLWLTAPLAWLVFWVAGAWFIVLFVIDARQYTVPDEISLPALAVIFLLNLAVGHDFWSLLLGMIIGGSWFLVQFLLSRGRWVGGGDVRLGLLMGALLGYPLIILGLMMAYIGGSIVAIGLIIAGRKKLGSRLPFATLLLPAALAAFLWGQGIWGWYVGLLGF